MKTKNNSNALFGMIFLVIMSLGLIGWLKNIAMLVGTPILQWGFFEAIRVVGIPAFPIGCLIGYF